jgi:nitric oxide reductase large subunit
MPTCHLNASIVAALAFKWQLGAWWVSLVQAHGHTPLFGWAGLFVLGVGLFFLPQLRGTTLARAELAPWALACLVTGIALRALCQPLLAFSQASMPQRAPYEALARSG